MLLSAAASLCFALRSVSVCLLMMQGGGLLWGVLVEGLDRPTNRSVLFADLSFKGVFLSSSGSAASINDATLTANTKEECISSMNVEGRGLYV